MVGPAGLGTGPQDDGHVANVGGYASRLSTACGELASTVVDPEVIASDLAGGRRAGHGHDYHGDSTFEDSTVHSDNASGLIAFLQAPLESSAILQATLLQSRLGVLAVGYLGPLIKRIWSSTPTHVQPDVCGLWATFLLQCWRRLDVVASGTPVLLSSGTLCNRHHRRAGARSSNDCFMDSVPLCSRRVSGSFVKLR